MNGRAWTADEDETLRINWPRFPAFLIAHVLRRGQASVDRRAHQLGLKKADDFETQPLARLWNGTEDPRSIAARFRPGSVLANEGLQRPGWAPSRMAATQFKRGARPASESRNYVPIGREKVDPKRKVLMRKLIDDPSIFPVKRWRPVHVIVWGGGTRHGARRTHRHSSPRHEDVRGGRYHRRPPGGCDHGREHAAQHLPQSLHAGSQRAHPPEARITRRINKCTKEQKHEEQGQGRPRPPGGHA